MSLTCPQCGNSLEQDFGVITCGRCHTVLFIDMEGQVQLANAEPAAPPENSADSHESPSSGVAADAGENWNGGRDSFDSNPEASPEFSSEADPAMPSWQSLQDPNSLSPQETESGGSFSVQEGGNGLAADPVSNTFDGDSADDGFHNEATSHAFGSEPANSDFSAGETLQTASSPVSLQSEGESLSEVSKFGNNEQDFGALSYTLLIENIDTGDIRNKLAEALTDSKFQWDVVELLQKIEKGRLEISQLNPVKASILVHRLQEVPVRVSWNQKLL